MYMYIHIHTRIRFCFPSNTADAAKRLLIYTFAQAARELQQKQHICQKQEIWDQDFTFGFRFFGYWCHDRCGDLRPDGPDCRVGWCSFSARFPWGSGGRGLQRLLLCKTLERLSVFGWCCDVFAPCLWPGHGRGYFFSAHVCFDGYRRESRRADLWLLCDPAL